MRHAVVLIMACAFAQVDPRADNLVKASRKKIRSLESFSVEFAYHVENKADTTQKTIHKKGLLRYKPSQNKFHLDLGDMLVICDGKTVWQYLKRENEVTLTSFDPKEGFSLEKVFRIYDQDMKVRLDQTDYAKGRKIHKISMFPVSDRTDYYRVEVWIDEATSLPQQIRFSHRDGTVVTYELRNFAATPLADNAFTFDPKQYPGVQTVDLR